MTRASGVAPRSESTLRGGDATPATSAPLGSRVLASLADVSEKTWQSQVVQLAKTLGFKTFHPFDSRRSAQGWPDLSLVRDRLVLLELKTEKGKLSDFQREMIRSLVAAGVETYVLRPRHLDLLALILSARAVFTCPDDDWLPYRLSTDAARQARAQLLTELLREIG